MSDRVQLWDTSVGLVRDDKLQFTLIPKIESTRRDLIDSIFDSLRGGNVLIWSGEHRAYWGSDGCGYYDRAQVGIYEFEDAHRRTRHCGPEKQIAYERIGTPITKLQLSMQASWIAKNAAAWAGDLLTLPETVNEPAGDESVKRFCASVRRQLEIIEGWGR